MDINITDEHIERFVSAAERIADALTRLAEGQYPKKKPVKQATVTRIPTEEDKAKEAQGASNEPIEEWIGLREQEFIEKEKTRQSDQNGVQTPVEEDVAAPRDN